MSGKIISPHEHNQYYMLKYWTVMPDTLYFANYLLAKL